MQRIAAVVALGCLTLAAASAQTRDPRDPPGSPDPLRALRAQFVSPPDDSRIMMRWWWFGSAVTNNEIARELQVMKAGGIGGVEVQPVYPLALDDDASGIRNLPFLSDGFLDALRFAADKADELQLRMDLTLGSGWPYGGPQVPIGQAAGRLRYEHVPVTSGTTRVPVPAIGAGERLLAVFTATSTGPSATASATDLANIREITDIRDGVVLLSGEAQPQQHVLFFIASRTGMMVKRPAIGAEGYVLDHYDRAAIDHYLDTVGARLLGALHTHPPYAIFCDSLEVFQSDWTGDLLEQFQQRRGYDLKPHLPALVANVGPETASVRRDWGKTLTELLDERFLHEFAQRHHTRLRLQGYGIPPATISSNALADLPEGEGWQWRQLQSTRWAASASHIYGRPVTSSETWTWLHSPVFRATPLDMKAEADLHFLQGITQLIGHGWPYTAEGVEAPGWRFYAAGVFDDQNPWWIAMPDVARYLQRVSFLLRQGEPANDVALYLPNDDAYARITGGRAHLLDGLRERLGPDVLGGILDGGFNVDVFDDAALASGKLKLASGAAADAGGYRVVVLPGVETMPVDTLKRLDAFSRDGGIVVATRRVPDRAPGFLATESDHRQVRELGARLRLVRDEKSELPQTLASLVPPDVELSPRVPEVGFIHRRTPDADIYFLANTSNTTQRVTATLRGSASSASSAGNLGAMPAIAVAAEIWNAVDGTATSADARMTPDGRVALPIALDAYASRVIVLPRGGSRSTGTNGSSGRGTPAARTLASQRAQQRRSQSNALPPIDISSGWTVTFGPQGQPMPMDRLRSWIDDDATRDFSGVATYERTVSVPATALRAGSGGESRLVLDFGEPTPIAVSREPNTRMQAWIDAPVREAAVVFVNDRRVGAVWCPPYAIDITDALRAGDNKLRIQVANLAINRMAARALPDYRLLNLRYGTRFEAQDIDKIRPVPAGLLGQIRVRGR
jgi:hypothetical protein